MSSPRFILISISLSVLTLLPFHTFAAGGASFAPSFEVFAGFQQSFDAAIARLPNGGQVIVGRGAPAGPSNGGIYARFFTADGTPKGEPVRVGDNGLAPSVAADAAGNLVVSWVRSVYQGGNIAPFTPIFTVRAQRLSADGNLRGPVIEVTRKTFAPPPPLPLAYTSQRIEMQASVAVDAIGNFAVAWKTEAVHTTAFGIGFSEPGLYAESSRYDRSIRVQRYRADGTPVGLTIPVTTQIGAPIPNVRFGELNTDHPALTMRDDGSFVVAWQDDGSSGSRVQGQRYDATGRKAGNRFDVPDCNSSPGIAGSADGRFVVSCLANGPGLYREVRAQRFDVNAVAVGAIVEVATEATQDALLTPAVAVAADGAFAVAWSGVEFNGPAVYGPIRARSFAADGSATGPVFTVDPDPATDEFTPAIGFNSYGDLSIAWTANATTAPFTSRVIAQRFGDH